MSDNLEHLKPKRYWALILLGPPLRTILAYAVFAALHPGLGLPRPTLEDAGLVASMLELVGFMALLIGVDFFVLGRIYRMKFLTPGWSMRKTDFRIIELLASSLGIVLGYATVLVASTAVSLQAIADFEKGGFIIFMAVFTSTLGFVGTVQQGERTLRDRADGATNEAGA